MIPIVFGVLGTGTEGFWNKMTSGDCPRFWDRLEYWEESWRPKAACSHSDSNEKASANAGVKNSQKSIIIIIIIITEK